jgi:two-component system, OmpR family, sensor histidine kinase QseC
MSLQRRLLLYLLLCAPLVWALALAVSVDRARLEVNELFDTEMIRLARQVQATLGSVKPGTAGEASAVPPSHDGDSGEADLRDLAIAVWDGAGRLVLADREGVRLPRRPDAAGFVEETLEGDRWRVYYLQASAGEWLVAAGQKVHEREELVFNLTASQLAPWLLVLPLLLLLMTWAVRRALAPLSQITDQIRQREAADLRPVVQADAPADLKPLLGAMNGLLARIEGTLVRERRFTADAAHELRTPLAALRAQWDVVRRAGSGDERARAEAQLGQGLDRMDRLVTQMLALSRVESASALPQPQPVRWPGIVEQVMTDCLATAERRRIELECDWPAPDRPALELQGDAHLLAVMLRNLLDNAVSYAPEGTTVTLRFGDDRLEVENDGPPLAPDLLARMGERFHRPAGQAESGSGLGVSIVQRIAALHGLTVSFGTRAGGSGVRVVVQRRPAPD